MACKFHAFMSNRPSPTPSSRSAAPLRGRRLAVPTLALVVSIVAALGAGVAPARAEKADRYQPLKVEADRQGKIDLVNNLVVFTGNVVVTKGTMVLRAAKVELRETSAGYHNAVAYGADGTPATFRQKRDGVDETIEGQADRLEYDGRADTIRFINHAVVRRLRGSTVADEISGNAGQLRQPGRGLQRVGRQPSLGQRGVRHIAGRVRAVISPRDGTAAAEEASRAASDPAPATTPASPAAPASGSRP